MGQAWGLLPYAWNRRIHGRYGVVPPTWADIFIGKVTINRFWVILLGMWGFCDSAMPLRWAWVMPVYVHTHGDYLFNQLDNPLLDDISIYQPLSNLAAVLPAPFTAGPSQWGLCQSWCASPCGSLKCSAERWMWVWAGIQHCLRLEGLESSWWNCPLFFQHVSRNTIKVDQSLGFFENHMSCGWGSNYQTGPASQARWGTSGYVSRHGRISQTWGRWAGHGSELANRMVLV